MKVNLYVLPAVRVSIGLLKAIYPLGYGLLQLVTEILPAYLPLKALLVTAKVAALPDPRTSMRQGDTEPVSKLPLVNSGDAGALNAKSTNVKPRSIRMRPARILAISARLMTKVLPRNIAFTGLLSQKPDIKH